MGEFTGGGTKVRCVDCTHLSGTRCARKAAPVSPKKRRICGVYDFKGEYVNRTSPQAMYMPNVDKSVQRLLRKLLRNNIIPVPAAGKEYKQFEMPKSTATAGVLQYGAPERVAEQAVLPGSEEENESDNSGS